MAEIAEAEICADLLSVLDLKRKDGESAADFTARVTKKASKCSEETWAELQEPTQEWVNAYLTAEDAKEEDLPLLVAEDDETGAEAAEAEPPNEEGVEDVENGKHINGAAKSKKAKKAKAEKESKKGAPPTAAKAAKGKTTATKPVKEAKARGRSSQYADTAKIKLLVKDNPHREGSYRHGIFKKYKNGMTVGEALAAGINRGDLYHAVLEERISIG